MIDERSALAGRPRVDERSVDNRREIYRATFNARRLYQRARAASRGVARDIFTLREILKTPPRRIFIVGGSKVASPQLIPLAEIRKRICRSE